MEDHNDTDTGTTLRAGDARIDPPVPPKRGPVVAEQDSGSPPDQYDYYHDPAYADDCDDPLATTPDPATYYEDPDYITAIDTPYDQYK